MRGALVRSIISRYGLINQERVRIKYLCKKCIRNQKLLCERKKREWLAYKLAAGDVKSFWKGWKHVKVVKHLKVINIDGYVGNEEICNGFSKVFQNSFYDSWSAGWAVDKLNGILHDLSISILVRSRQQCLHCRRSLMLLIV